MEAASAWILEAAHLAQTALLAVEQATLEMVAAVVTTTNRADGPVLPDWLDQVDEILEQVSGDGADDQQPGSEAIAQHPARAAIPPRKGARLWQHGHRRGDPHPRDESLRRIRPVGRWQWKQESGSHRRSLVETEMVRFKTIFGDRLSAGAFEGQAAQLLLRTRALNQMTHRGRPDSDVT